MKKEEQVTGINEAMHIDAFRFGIVDKEDADCFVLDLGKEISGKSADKREIENFTSIAISPDEFKILLHQIIHIGLKYNDDFWEGIVDFRDELEDGDDGKA